VLNGVPLLGGKVAWVFGSIFHVFSHPIYFIYRQDLGFIENDFLFGQWIVSVGLIAKRWQLKSILLVV